MAAAPAGPACAGWSGLLARHSVVLAVASPQTPRLSPGPVIRSGVLSFPVISLLKVKTVSHFIKCFFLHLLMVTFSCWFVFFLILFMCEEHIFPTLN